MDYEVQINRRFEINLTKIYAYISREWGLKVADEFYKKIMTRMNLLKKHPFAGPPSKKRPNTRCILAGNHNRIYYRVQGNIITILAIFDTRIDPNRNPYK
jgi:plasmid stabilization system protein ParE